MELKITKLTSIFSYICILGFFIRVNSNSRFLPQCSLDIMTFKWLTDSKSFFSSLNFMPYLSDNWHFQLSLYLNFVASSKMYSSLIARVIISVQYNFWIYYKLYNIISCSIDCIISAFWWDLYVSILDS